MTVTPERVGPWVEPTPLPKPSRREVRARLARTLGSGARHLTVPLLAAAVRRPGAGQRIARGLRLAFDELGATYIKFGQLLASSPSLFGEEAAAEFRHCLDAGAPVPFELVRAQVEADLGQPIDRLFASFDTEPLAAASIAVVHKATLAGGREVAVKVLRPSIEDVVAADIAIMRPLFNFAGRQIAVGIAGTLPGLLDGLEEQVSEELDLRNEARAIDWFRDAVATMGLHLVRVPEVVPALSGRRVLTMEFLDGHAIDDLERLVVGTHDLRPAVIQTLQAWFAATLAHGVFHGDIHAGNLLVLRDGSIGVVDWGIVGRLDADTHRFFRRLIEGSLGDEEAWLDVRSHLLSVYGNGIQETLGFDDDQMAEFIKRQVQPLMTTPFGQLDLRAMLIGTGGTGTPMPTGPSPDAAAGPAPRPRRLVDRYRFWQEQRALQKKMLNSPGRGSSFDRGTFLLTKQLVYLDRYGKLYLPDIPLLWDPEVFAALLALGPADA